MTSYPSSLARFAVHRDSDLDDLATAGHVNDLQDEVRALQTYIGAHPAAGYPDVGARIARGARANLAAPDAQHYTAARAGLYRVSVTWTPRAAPEGALGYRLLVGALVISGATLAGEGYGALPHGGEHLVRLPKGASVRVEGYAPTNTGSAVPTITVRRVAG